LHELVYISFAASITINIILTWQPKKEKGEVDEEEKKI
jgi:hypothetical protein